MQKLITGIHQFQSTIVKERAPLFQKLASGQSPEVLFITCSDSRIDPNLLTQTEPGELFVIRNAGNMVPPYSPEIPGGGEAPSIEFAIQTLKVRHVVVCGHTDCGAMKGVLQPELVASLPAVSAWVAQGQSVRENILSDYADASPDVRLSLAIQKNVLAQLENLKTHPAVQQALAEGRLDLHGWIYDIGTGDVWMYNPDADEFTPLQASTQAACI